MNWHPTEFRSPNTSRFRAIAWRCNTNRRLEVRHCGHPTALRPYYIRIDGKDRIEDLGTFRLLPEAQLAAERAVEA